MNDNLPWPIAGQPLSPEFVLGEIDDAITEAIGEIAPGGPPYEAGRILENIERRLEVTALYNHCLPPADHVARKMLTVSFVRSRMSAAADEIQRGFQGHAIKNGEVFVRIRRPKHYVGADPENRITGVVFPEDDGDPVVTMGMRL
jgi:hypothetical protein